MDDVLKAKFKTLIKKTKALEKDDDFTTDFKTWLPQAVAVEAAERERRSFATHPMPLTALEEDEVLATMEKEYYDPCFDSSSHELCKYETAGIMDQEGIDVHRQRLLRQLKVVTKRTFARILERRPKCSLEMERVSAVSKRIDDAAGKCLRGRRGLDQARLKFTSSSLGILSACKRRQRAVALVEDLVIINTLQKTDVRLQQLLSAGNYPGAIQLLLEGQKAVSTYKHFTSIQQLAVKLQDTLDLTEEQLDVALSKVCVDFNREKYALLVEAYSLLGLGKTQSSMDQLHMHLTSAIHNTAWNVVYGHAVLSSRQTSTTPLAADDLSKKLYVDVCANLATSSLLPCLVDLSRALWNIMNSYKSIVTFHRERNDDAGLEHEEAALEKQYVAKKLNNGLTRIWQDVQTKVRLLIVSNDMSDLTIDQFLAVMDVLHTLMEAGNAFSSQSSSSFPPQGLLQHSLKRQCFTYFHGYHLERLQEIRMHLENEGWVPCPVKETFNIFHLQEFRHHLKRNCSGSPRKVAAAAASKAGWSTKCPFESSSRNAGSNQKDEDFFLSSSGNNNDDENSDEDVPAELRRNFVEEDHDHRLVTSTPTKRSKLGASSNRKKNRGHAGPVLTTTSLMLLRLCGKYLHLMQMLQPIARDVFIAMTQLIEYYFINVHHLFTSDIQTESHLNVLASSAKFSAVIARIDRTILATAAQDAPPFQAGNNDVSALNKSSISINFPSIGISNNNNNNLSNVRSNSSFNLSAAGSTEDAMPTANDHNHDESAFASQEYLGMKLAELNFLVDLSDPANLYGFSERYVASESVIYVLDQLRLLKSSIVQFVGTEGENADDHLVDEYFSQTIDVMEEVRNIVFLPVSERSVNSEATLHQMNKVSWNIKDVRSQHNDYVDILLRDLQTFGMRLEELERSLHVQEKSKSVLWGMCAFVTALIFVDGFSNAKKCSNEGRALMQLDYRQFVMKLEKMCNMKPIPHQDYVIQYVQAFYIPEVELENWVKYHNEYSAKQLVSLVDCVAYSNNKTKQKLNSLISEISGKIRR